MKDIIVDKIRKVRHEIECQYQDTDKYLEHIYADQKKHGPKLVRRQPKPLRKRKAV